MQTLRHASQILPPQVLKPMFSVETVVLNGVCADAGVKVGMWLTKFQANKVLQPLGDRVGLLDNAIKRSPKPWQFTFSLYPSGGAVVPPLISPEREGMEAVGKADKEMAPYTLLRVEGQGEALYLSFEKKWVGANRHTLYLCASRRVSALALRNQTWRVLALPSEPATELVRGQHAKTLMDACPGAVAQ
eukprot:COSAG05_NODE_549_length_8747_cov_8.305851_3_plen_189_part_00